MKEYTKSVVRVVKFETEDVIVASVSPPQEPKTYEVVCPPVAG